MKSRRHEKLIEKLNGMNFEDNFYRQVNSAAFNRLLHIITDSEDFKQLKSRLAKDSSLNQWVHDITPSLADEQYTLKTRLYWILFDIRDFPKCDNEKCGKPILKNVDLYWGYDSRSGNGNKYCCHRCSVSSLANKQQHIQTCLERYGETSHFKTRKCKDKIRRTSLERYGTGNPGCGEKALMKARATNIRLYGTPYPAQSDKIKEKTRQSFIRRYNVDNNMKCREGLAMYQEAMQRKYGEGIVTNFQLEQTKENSRQTKLERYRDQNFNNHEKTRQTKFKKYGDENFNNRLKFE